MRKLSGVSVLPRGFAVTLEAQEGGETSNDVSKLRTTLPRSPRAARHVTAGWRALGRSAPGGVLRLLLSSVPASGPPP